MEGLYIYNLLNYLILRSRICLILGLNFFREKLPNWGKIFVVHNFYQHTYLNSIISAMRVCLQYSEQTTKLCDDKIVQFLKIKWMHEKEGPNNQLHLNSDSKEMINYFKTVYIYVKFIELLKKMLIVSILSTTKYMRS